MKINEPIGNSNIGPFLIRIPLGAYLLMAGLVKLDNLPAFIDQVRQFNVVSPNVARLYATLLPYLEIVSGVLLCMGFWTTLASALSSLLLISFIFGLKLFPNDNYIFNKDVILLGASLSLLFTGAGSLSVDKFRRDG